ncbi:flagellar biosynthesis protein FlhF [Lentibacillus sp. N15]|uniref:flagellar biosynthesis protein FlhF n=1 Tax=Lentibacillus songyuanensis TaxID=3136161 RepID=UPI0031BAB97B
MKVKKFVAPTMPEAMQQIRKELGKDAVILHSKEVRGSGVLKRFKKRKIEVVAALDPDPPKHKQGNSAGSFTNSSLTRNDAPSEQVLTEIKQLKKLVEAQTAATQVTFPPDYKIVYQHLLDQEVTEELVKVWMTEILDQHREKESIPTQAEIRHDVQRIIQDKLRDLPFQGISYTNKLVQFVGPTGVGKTTTLAKLAARCVLQDHKKVAFITQDTYRIAAIEQLKTYARILDVPMEVAYNWTDYQAAIAKFQDYDLIFVDTAGRNFRDSTYVDDLNRMIHPNAQTYLVLSLTAKPKDICEIYQQFQHVPLKSLIFTKIDETRQYGSIVNLMCHYQIGVAYLTNGQGVPDDLLVPTPEVIASYMIGDPDET